MNPTVTVPQHIVRRPIVNDISRPPAISPSPLPAVPVATRPQIVSNIPLRAPINRPLGDDEELERIMRDVGRELKASEKKPTKKHFSFLSRKQKAGPVKTILAQPLSAAPGQSGASVSVNPAPAPVSQIAPAALNQAALKSAEKEKKSMPVLVFLLTIVAASALIAMAWSAYAS